MGDLIIKAEGIGKKYMISHQYRGKYTALRDVIAQKTKNLTKRLRAPFSSVKTTSSLEEFWALKNISFDIERGDAVGIIGYNGAGKSTLLKIMSRITEPTTGKVKIKGQVASLLEVGTGFHPELTGRENVFLNGAILGMPKKNIIRKFDEIISFAEVKKFEDTPVKRYSSGMYVRLAFAVAAHLDSEILLIDEVLAVGDILFQKKCLGKMEDITKKGRTILFVSHNMNAIRNLCDRVIWLADGKIKKIGLTNDIVEEYEKEQILHYDTVSSVVERNLQKFKKSNFYFSRVKLKNSEGENSTIFKYLDKLIVIVEVRGKLEINTFNVEFRIYKETGEFACVGSSGAFHGISFNKNTKKIKIEVGPLSLTNGKYNVELTALSGNDIKDVWSNACSFHVVECCPFALKHEISKPVCVIAHDFLALD